MNELNTSRLWHTQSTVATVLASFVPKYKHAVDIAFNLASYRFNNYSMFFHVLVNTFGASPVLWSSC